MITSLKDTYMMPIDKNLTRRLPSNLREWDDVLISGYCYSCYSSKSRGWGETFYYNQPATIATIEKDAIKVWMERLDGKFWFDPRFVRIERLGW
jgi:hypothetical protein